MKKFSLGACTALRNSAYFSALHTAMSEARSRVWVNMFYTSLMPRADTDFLGRTLLETLQVKVTDGLNIKFLIGTDSTSTSLEVGNQVVYSQLKRMRIPVRAYRGDKDYSHRKYVLIDEDIAIVGSHNWSHRSLSRGRDDSLMIRSRNLARYLSNDFHKQWTR